MNTIENNKIIAEFMGKKELITESQFLSMEHKAHNPTIIESLKYHSDWNWLMEVVEKMENILLPDTDNCFNVTIGSGLYCTIQDAYGELIEISTDGATKIEATYNACVEFIKWYNLNN